MKNTVGIGLVQWEARAFGSFEEFCAEAEGYVRSLAAYRPDFVLFPEYFTLCLAAGQSGDDQAMLRYVAGFTDDLRHFFSTLAGRYGTNIIAGSMPLLESGRLYNVSWLCHRDGRYDQYRKTHLTPFERGWNLSAGNSLPVFETDCGRVGILICYDAEFPEAARKMAHEGARILFVPYQTDTQQGYWRVRLCAQARAVENECYVATAGLTGNMPQLPLVEFQYARAAVFTPSDMFFPTGGVQTEATANVPTGIFTELDMQLLERLHTAGSVRTMSDIRPELYGTAH